MVRGAHVSEICGDQGPVCRWCWPRGDATVGGGHRLGALDAAAAAPHEPVRNRARGHEGGHGNDGTDARNQRHVRAALVRRRRRRHHRPKPLRRVLVAADCLLHAYAVSSTRAAPHTSLARPRRHVPHPTYREKLLVLVIYEALGKLCVNLAHG